MDRARPGGGGGGGGGGRGPAGLVVAVIVSLLVGSSLGFVTGLVTGRWSATLAPTRYGGEGWVLEAVEYVSGDPAEVSAEPLTPGDDWLVTVVMPGSGPVDDRCRQPPSVADAAVAPSGEWFAVSLTWERRGCELGPTRFRFRVTGLGLPFAVGLVRGQECHVASVQEPGTVAVTVESETHPACGGLHR